MNVDSEAQQQFERQLQAALKQVAPYAIRTASADRTGTPGIPAAVLILFAWEVGQPHVLLTKRTEFVDTHKGQYAFPGGRVETEDPSIVSTALRETEEEVGIPISWVRVLGELPGLGTPTGYWIIPVVGILNQALARTPLKINAEETEEAFWVSLAELRQEGVYRSEELILGAHTVSVAVYQLGARKIWGATAAMLKNLLDRLANVG